MRRVGREYRDLTVLVSDIYLLDISQQCENGNGGANYQQYKGQTLALELPAQTHNAQKGAGRRWLGEELPKIVSRCIVIWKGAYCPEDCAGLPMLHQDVRGVQRLLHAVQQHQLQPLTEWVG
jgi:hypothetical protein